MSSNPEQLAIVSTLEAHPEHVRAIGMVTIEIANLDLELGGLLGSLLRLSRKGGQIVYLTPNAGIARVKIVENLAKSVLQPKSTGLKRIEELLVRAKAIIGKRHEYIHNAWGSDDPESGDPAHIRRVKLPAMGDGDSKPVPITELHDIITKARVLIFDIRTETNAVIASWPKSSPDKLLVPGHGESSPGSPPEQKYLPLRWLRQLRSFLASLRRRS
jgi:hypothetical protein